jgi:hypothetical protein
MFSGMWSDFQTSCGVARSGDYIDNPGPAGLAPGIVGEIVIFHHVRGLPNRVVAQIASGWPTTIDTGL